MTRHQMRQSAVMLTFERLFNDDSIESILETAKECETVPVDDKVIALFRGVDARRDVLKNWTLPRISRVSLAVLRVAMYEILFVEDMNTDIAISEAVKIAQEFTGREDVSFINGVLSSVSKSLKAQPAGEGADHAPVSGD